MDDFIPHDSLGSLLEKLKRNPRKALIWCRNRFQASAAGYHETLYDTIAFIVAFVLHLEANERDRRAFLEDDYWSEKPHSPKEKDLSRLATMYIIGAKTSRGALYNQGLIYTKVADHLLDINIEPSEIPAELKRKPIYKILDEINAKNAKEEATDEGTSSHVPAVAHGSGSNSDSVSDGNGNQELLGGEQLGTGDQDDADERDEADGETEPTKLGVHVPDTDANGLRQPESTRRRFDAKRHIALRGNEYLTAILALRSRERLWVCVQRTDEAGDGNWKELVAIAVEQDEASPR